MKKKAFCNAIKCNFTRVVMLSGLIIFIGGCAGPRILQERNGVPPATLEPGQTTEAMTGSTELNLPTSTEQSEFPTFPKVVTKPLTYKVKRGDSFWKIARMYGVGMKELAAYNNMDIKKHLVAGKVLNIPPGGKLIPESELKPIKSRKNIKNFSKAETLKGGVYTIRPGDSLWIIARRYHTTVAKIATANNINKNDKLTVGQKLVVPGMSKEATKIAKAEVPVKAASKAVPLSQKDNELIDNLIDSSKQQTTSNAFSKSVDTTISTTNNFLPHTVKDGDSWNTISEMYGVSIDNLKKANPKIASNTEPTVGSVINIPED